MLDKLSLIYKIIPEQDIICQNTLKFLLLLNISNDVDTNAAFMYFHCFSSSIQAISLAMSMNNLLVDLISLFLQFYFKIGVSYGYTEKR
jgi:hypothetical protein